MTQVRAGETRRGPFLLLAGCCLLLAVVFTWPLSLHFGSAIPYRGTTSIR
jgi:hypothetical protein